MRYTTNTKISNINSNNNSIFKSNLNEDIKNKNNNDTFSKRNKSANLIRSKKN